MGRRRFRETRGLPRLLESVQEALSLRPTVDTGRIARAERRCECTRHHWSCARFTVSGRLTGGVRNRWQRWTLARFLFCPGLVARSGHDLERGFFEMPHFRLVAYLAPSTPDTKEVSR